MRYVTPAIRGAEVAPRPWKLIFRGKDLRKDVDGGRKKESQGEREKSRGEGAREKKKG